MAIDIVVPSTPTLALAGIAPTIHKTRRVGLAAPYGDYLGVLQAQGGNALYWPFNEVSGYTAICNKIGSEGSAASTYNATYITTAQANYNQHLGRPYGDDSFLCPLMTTTPPTWVRAGADASNVLQDYLAAATNSTGMSFTCMVAFTAYGGSQLFTTQHGAVGAMQLQVGYTSGTNMTFTMYVRHAAADTERSIANVVPITLKRWYHLGMTSITGSQIFYVNGVAQGTTGAYAQSSFNSLANPGAGNADGFSKFTGLGYALDGYMFCPYLRKSVLTPAQMLEQAHTGLAYFSQKPVTRPVRGLYSIPHLNR